MKLLSRDLLRLAVPVVVAHAGIMAMSLVDTIMVGHYSATELAYQSIGLSPIMTLLVTTMGLTMGTLVLTAHAYGAGQYRDCGAVWRRGLAYAALLGLACALFCLAGEPFLLFSGQSADLARGGGAVMQVIGFGLPAAMIFYIDSFFLEAIKRPWPVTIAMLAANALNAGLNWLLVFGHGGFEPMGALGSAWATTVSRLALALGLTVYILVMRDKARFGVRLRPTGGWGAWARQRRLGYAAGLSMGMESAAFSMLTIFAGWLGPLPLGAFAILLNLSILVFMLATGIGAATAVLVGNAWGRHDVRGMALAGWLGLGLNSSIVALIGIAFAMLPAELVGLYTGDAQLTTIAVPLVSLVAWFLVVDGGQGVMANALRGRGDTWVPPMLHSISYFGVMLPLAYWFTFGRGHGLAGLIEAILLASIVSVSLLSGRFWLLAARDAGH